MEIIKQLYDIARLFEKTEVLETTTKSFVQIAEAVSYTHLDVYKRQVLQRQQQVRHERALHYL